MNRGPLEPSAMKLPGPASSSPILLFIKKGTAREDGFSSTGAMTTAAAATSACSLDKAAVRASVLVADRGSARPAGIPGKNMLCNRCPSKIHLIWILFSDTGSRLAATDRLNAFARSAVIILADQAPHCAASTVSHDYLMLYCQVRHSDVNSLCVDTEHHYRLECVVGNPRDRLDRQLTARSRAWLAHPSRGVHHFTLLRWRKELRLNPSHYCAQMMCFLSGANYLFRCGRTIGLY